MLCTVSWHGYCSAVRRLIHLDGDAVVVIYAVHLSIATFMANWFCGTFGIEVCAMHTGLCGGRHKWTNTIRLFVNRKAHFRVHAAVCTRTYFNFNKYLRALLWALSMHLFDTTNLFYGRQLAFAFEWQISFQSFFSPLPHRNASLFSQCHWPLAHKWCE